MLDRLAHDDPDVANISVLNFQQDPSVLSYFEALTDEELDRLSSITAVADPDAPLSEFVEQAMVRRP